MLPILSQVLSPISGRHSGKGLRNPSSFAGVSLGGAICLAVLGFALVGCGGGANSGKAKAAPISLTNAAGVTGPVSALPLATTLKLSMMPVGDTQNAGV